MAQFLNCCDIQLFIWLNFFFFFLLLDISSNVLILETRFVKVKQDLLKEDNYNIISVYCYCHMDIVLERSLWLCFIEICVLLMTAFFSSDVVVNTTVNGNCMCWALDSHCHGYKCFITVPLDHIMKIIYTS